MEKQTGNSNAYHFMDSVRALAAFAVVWNHTWNITIDHAGQKFTGIWSIVNRSASFGPDAVMVFFVISGYFISHSVQNRIASDRWSWTGYSFDRLARLWIVLIPALVLGATYDCLGVWATQAQIYSATRGDPSAIFSVIDRLTILNFTASVFFIQPFFMHPLGTNGPVWSLSYEFWYYVWFPALFTLYKFRKLSFPILLFLFITLVTIVLFYQATLLFPCWLIGAALCLYFRNSTTSSRLGFISRSAILLIGCLVFVLSVMITRLFTQPWPVHCIIIASGFGICMGSLLLAEPPFPKILRILSSYGSKASFSLYVTHLPLLILMNSIIAPQRGLPTSPRTFILCIIMSALLIIHGWLFSLFTEQKTQFVKSFLTRKRKPHLPKGINE